MPTGSLLYTGLMCAEGVRRSRQLKRTVSAVKNGGKKCSAAGHFHAVAQAIASRTQAILKEGGTHVNKM